jgi:hypothetical protein
MRSDRGEERQPGIGPTVALPHRMLALDDDSPPGHVANAELRPALVCRQLLQATDSSEGRRKRRKRNTTPDALGMEVKRDLLAAAVTNDPDPDDFEAWLFVQVQASGNLAGATRAMALQIWDEWQFALASGGFREWLAAGAPSDDSQAGTDMGLDPRG